MKLEEIHELWEKDAFIDSTDLTSESLKIPKLLSKYYRIFIEEKKTLMITMKKYKELKHEKYEFLCNPTEEDVREKGWKVPARTILKSEYTNYLDGDSDLLNLELKVGVQQEKVDFLKSILQSLSTRGFLIKNAIEDRKYMNGG